MVLDHVNLKSRSIKIEIRLRVQLRPAPVRHPAPKSPELLTGDKWPRVRAFAHLFPGFPRNFMVAALFLRV